MINIFHDVRCLTQRRAMTDGMSNYPVVDGLWRYNDLAGSSRTRVSEKKCFSSPEFSAVSRAATLIASWTGTILVAEAVSITRSGEISLHTGVQPSLRRFEAAP